MSGFKLIAFVAATPPSFEFFVASRRLKRLSRNDIAGDFLLFTAELAFVVVVIVVVVAIVEVVGVIGVVGNVGGDTVPPSVVLLSDDAIRLLRLVDNGVRFRIVSFVPIA